MFIVWRRYVPRFPFPIKPILIRISPFHEYILLYINLDNVKRTRFQLQFIYYLLSI